MSALASLLSARALLCRGWAHDGMALDEKGREVFCTPHHATAVAWSLAGAMACAEGSPISRYRASLIVRRCLYEPNLVAWNAHPLRTVDEAVDALDLAIRALGGTPPPLRPMRKHLHRGGWRVTSRGES